MQAMWLFVLISFALLAVWVWLRARRDARPSGRRRQDAAERMRIEEELRRGKHGPTVAGGQHQR